MNCRFARLRAAALALSQACVFAGAGLAAEPDVISVDSNGRPIPVSGYNLTGHFNPEAVHGNIADPAYGLFFGQRGRRFTADFDVLF
jgi:hypothetical protein